MTEIDNSSPRKLNDKELLSRTKILVSEERELLTRVLRHLQEIDRRKLYLHAGYSSLWAYCTQELGYTEAAAQRRIEAMRALREYPALEAKIENGALSLSAIAKVQSLVRRVNKSPKVDNARLTVSSEEKLELVLALENKTQKESDEILAARFPEQIKKMEKVRPVSSEHFEVKFVATKEMMDKLDQVKSLLSHKNPNASAPEGMASGGWVLRV